MQGTRAGLDVSPRPVLLEGVNCTGAEDRLTECPGKGLGANVYGAVTCTSSERTLALVCRNRTNSGEPAIMMYRQSRRMFSAVVRKYVCACQ